MSLIGIQNLLIDFIDFFVVYRLFIKTAVHKKIYNNNIIIRFQMLFASFGQYYTYAALFA